MIKYIGLTRFRSSEVRRTCIHNICKRNSLVYLFIYHLERISEEELFFGGDFKLLWYKCFLLSLLYWRWGGSSKITETCHYTSVSNLIIVHRLWIESGYFCTGTHPR